MGVTAGPGDSPTGETMAALPPGPAVRTGAVAAAVRAVLWRRAAAEREDVGDAGRVNGYVVEAAANGAWWVRRPDRPRQGWRFATRGQALRFAQRIPPPPAPAPPAGSAPRRPPARRPPRPQRPGAPG